MKTEVRDQRAEVRSRRSAVGLVVMLLALVALAARAQTNFTIDWFSIDGGGGTSTGGVYSVSATIGQPDAGRMSGGNLTLGGGFWGLIAAIQTPGAPWLTITRTNGNVIVSWPLPATDFVLEQTTSFTGSPFPWTPVAPPYLTNATHIFITVSVPIGTKFYRLRKPQ